MVDYLKRYKVVLNTIGPVYIGSGKTLKKKEYILDRRREKAIICDQRKLYTFLSQKKLLKSFEEFFLNENKLFFAWLSDNRIYEDSYSVFEKYELDISGIEGIKNVRDMSLFIKDAYGKPYIPGSSLKGAIRNALLAKMISEKSYDTYKIERQISDYSGVPKKFLRDEAGQLETDFFNVLSRDEKNKKNAVNDKMRGIRVSDSLPLDYSDMVLCQKIDVHPTKGETALPIVRECIKPDTRVEMELTIDTKETDINVDEIRESIDEFLALYNVLFLDNFQDEIQYESDVIYLGGGVGFASKTVTNELFGKNKNRVKITSKIIDKTLKEKKHAGDAQMGVSPHVAKLTEYDGSLTQMGPTEIRFIEM